MREVLDPSVAFRSMLVPISTTPRHGQLTHHHAHPPSGTADLFGAYGIVMGLKARGTDLSDKAF
jgi:hypothetical protein